MEKLSVGVLADVFSIIAQYLPVQYLYNFPLTCKSYLALNDKSVFRLATHFVNGITLRRTQAILRQEFAKDIGLTSFCGAISIGKTIGGFACCTDASLIVCTTNVVNTWIAESKQLGWYSPNPVLSKVLFYSSKVCKHYKYLKEIPDDHTEVSTKIIVVPCGNKLSISNLYNAIGFIKRMDCEQKVVVIDEAHIFNSKFISHISHKTRKDQESVFDRGLLLSATPLDDKVRKYVSRFITASSPVLRVPKIKWRILQTENIKEDSEEISTAHDKICVITTNVNIEYMAKEEGFPDKKIFILKGGATTIPRFNAYEDKAILFVNTNQNEGINVHANALIIPNPGEMNTNNLIQTFGRVLRTGNDNEYVYIYLLCFGDLDFYRACYARCFSINAWKFKYDTAPTLSYLVKCAAMFRLTGTKMDTIRKEDGCILFADPVLLGKKGPKKLYDWWKENTPGDASLYEESIKDILGYY